MPRSVSSGSVTSPSPCVRPGSYRPSPPPQRATRSIRATFVASYRAEVAVRPARRRHRRTRSRPGMARVSRTRRTGSLERARFAAPVGEGKNVAWKTPVPGPAGPRRCRWRSRLVDDCNRAARHFPSRARLRYRNRARGRQRRSVQHSVLSPGDQSSNSWACRRP